MKHFADPRPMTGRERVAEFQHFAAELRKRADAAILAANPKPFPDPEGEDRDRRRVMTWDFTRG